MRSAARPTASPSLLVVVALWGLSFGVLEAAYFTRANQAFPLGFGHLALALLLGLAHAALAWAAGIAARVVPGGIDRAAARLVAAPAALAFLLALSHYRDRLNTRPRSLEGTLITLGIVAFFALAFLVLRRLAESRPRAARRATLAGGAALLLGGTLWLATLGPDPRRDSSERLRAELEAGATLDWPAESVSAEMVGGADDTGLKVLMIPLDGGAWSVFDPLLEAGRLPNIAALIDRGVHATLETDIPTYSPIIWTSVATGKYPTRHGIHGFIRTRLPLGLPQLRLETKRMAALTKVLKLGIRALEMGGGLWPAVAPPVEIYGSNDVRARPLWDLLGEFGMQSMVLEWYISHPARPMRGIQVSERFHLMKGVAAEIPNIVYPDSLAPELEASVVAPEEIDDQRLLSLIDLEGLEGPAVGAFVDQNRAWFDMVRKNMARDLSTVQLAEAVFPTLPDWRFAATYFRAMDGLHHYTWKRKDLPAEDFAAHPERRFHDAIERYYEFCDRIVERVARHADDSTVIMVLSDHGFENTYDHERGPEGFFIMAGGPVERRRERGRISIYDIAPTVLALLGVPVPDDMDGRVAVEMLPGELWAEHPVRNVPSYEHDSSARVVEPSSHMDEEVLDRLRALGYIR